MACLSLLVIDRKGLPALSSLQHGTMLSSGSALSWSIRFML